MLDSCASMIPRTLKRWREGRFGEEEDWREIPDQIELEPGVVIEIPKPRITSVLERDAERSIPPDFSGAKSDNRPSKQHPQKPRNR
jgi:hypothetical protein